MIDDAMTAIEDENKKLKGILCDCNHRGHKKTGLYSDIGMYDWLLYVLILVKSIILLIEVIIFTDSRK